ncbi:MAG: amidohydrolase family protein [Pyrinomonadaceae bacterium]
MKIFRNKSFIIFLSALIFCFQSLHFDARAQKPLLQPKTFKFINGQWFDGKNFKPRTFYSEGGILTQNKPLKIDEVIDLANGYVVPPFGDAHTHMLDGAFQIKQQVDMYLRDGVFYAKVVTNTFTGASAASSYVNNPTSVDAAYSHGGLTADYSHPIEVYEALALGFYNRNQQQENIDRIWASRLRENDAYYIIDTADDLESKWSSILEKRPDFIKVYLWHSEGYDERLKQKGRTGGVDPQLLPAIVSKAHAAGLRVTAAVNTAYDFHVALLAGVDEMSHLPGYFFAENEDIRIYEISLEDAKLAKKLDVTITITGSVYTANVTPERARPIKVNQIRNLKLLKSQNVRLAIGSDNYGKTPYVEVAYLKNLGVFSNLELLKMWCEDTPKTIFPKRRIGRLKKGCEASFLVLDGNPLKDLEQTKKIRLRFKQGNFINISEKKS